MDKMTYNVKDIIKITGFGETKSYELLHKVQESFIKEFPNGILMTNRVPRWYFDERVLGIKEENIKE